MKDYQLPHAEIIASLSMRIFRYWKSIVTVVLCILMVFVATSLFDVVLSVLSMRFYSTAAFIAIFGVGGVFAAVIAYPSGIAKAPLKNETARWVVISSVVITGVIFLFVLSPLEGGEYEVPFKAFGISSSLACLLFIKGKVEL